MTVAPHNKKPFETVMKGNAFAEIGKVTKEKRVSINGLEGNRIVDLGLEDAVGAYRGTFEGY